MGPKILAGMLLGLLALALASPPCHCLQEPDPLWKLRAFQAGGDPAVPDAVADWVAKARSEPASRARAATRLLEVASSTEVPAEARRIALRHLALVGSDAEATGLRALLSEQEVAEYAAMALERIPGEAATRALIQGLENGIPRLRVALLAAVAERRSAAAVPTVTRLASDPDPNVGNMALQTLARIADAEALAALRTVVAGLPSERHEQGAAALLEAAEILSKEARTEEARGLISLLDPMRLPEGLRARHFLVQVALNPATALDRVIQAFERGDGVERRVAAQVARQIPGAHATRRLASLLEAMPDPEQRLLLTALADRRDPAATVAISRLLRSPSVETQVAAALTLGAIGGERAVPPLLAAAAGPPGPARDAAAAALERLRGASVDTALTRGLVSATPAVQAAALTALTARRHAGTPEIALRHLRSRSPAVAEAASKALRDLGQPTHLSQVLDAALAAPRAQRAHLLDTAAALALRMPNPARRAEPILRRMRALKSPAERAELLNLAAMLGGAEALQAVRSALVEKHEELRTTALQALCAWPTDEPLGDLRAVIRKPRNSRERSIALRGFVQMIDHNNRRVAAQAEALYREALGYCRSAAERRMLLGGLAGLPTVGSLELIATLARDPEVGTEAEAALLQVAPATLAARTERTLELLRAVAENSRDDEHRARARTLAQLASKMEDMLLAWEVSPPYESAGLTCHDLFDTPFAPELAAQVDRVPWRLMPVLTNPEQPWLLDLLALYPGEQKVAYVRTRLWSDQARTVILELGTDDGAKLWLNGRVVFANNTQRAVAPAQDSVPLDLVRGWNNLLLKVTQNVMGWGVAARLVDAAGGGPPSGVRVDPLSRDG